MSKPLRILMQNRPNALTQPGGDTVVMLQLKRALERRGYRVDLDLVGEKHSGEYDLVHLFNLVTAEITEAYARAATRANIPYVVTALYEDWPLFFNQMHQGFAVLQAHLLQQQSEGLGGVLAESVAKVPHRAAPDSAFTIEHASAVMVTGAREAAALRRDYPQCDRIFYYHCGTDSNLGADDPEPFIARYGVKDFILSVGRLECRKNQLLLLEALREITAPVVLVSGGVSYQPDYEQLVRNFRRRGPTLILDRLDAPMLRSAYAAARIHALPSWYELPGLVSLEAARVGRNIVVGDQGTPRDYFGDDAFYCLPYDPDAIRDGVLAAWESVVRPGLRARVEELTWDRTATEVRAIYDEVLERVSRRDMTSAPPADIPVEASDSSLRELCDRADGLARAGQHEAALEKFDEAARLEPQAARAHRGRAVLLFLLGRRSEAKVAFERALALDPHDSRAMTGLGAVRWEEGDGEGAFRLYREALKRNQNDTTALTYLMNAAYSLNRLADLQEALEAFLQGDPDNPDINFCLAGCYFKQGRLDDAERVNKHVLRVLPRYPHGLELKSLIEKEQANGRAAPSGVEQKSFPSPGVSERLVAIEEAQRQRQFAVALELLAALERETRMSEEERARVTTVRGEVLACLGSLDEADRLFQLVESHPKWGYRALAGRGIIAAAKEQWEQGERLFKRSIELFREFDVAHAGLGVCALKRNDVEQAWREFGRALDLNPENKRALYGIVQLGYPLGRLGEVEEAIGRYLDANPADLHMLYSYAGCCYAQGKVREAIRELEKIRLFEPGHVLANELLNRIRDEQPRAAAQH